MVSYTYKDSFPCAGPGTAMLKAGSINPLRSSSAVRWSFCCKFLSLVEGPNRASSCVFWRNNVRLLLTTITISHSISVLTPASIPREQAQVELNVNQYQLSIQYQVCCLFQVTKVTWSSDSLRKMFFWLFVVQSWIRAHSKLSKAGKLLDLSQYIFSLNHTSILKH